MSSGDRNNDASPSNSAPSPGKGGKSLELMQKRMMAEQHSQLQQMPEPPSAPPSVSAPAAQQTSRPKGKDFASMSARAPLQPPQVPLPQQQQQQQQQQAPLPTRPSTGKPKGKDFSAMASRMPIPPSVETLSQSHPLHAEEQSAQVARAAQMQAAARAAAGLPPLDRPTATTVTTTPPTIPAPRISVSQHPGLSPPPQQQQPHHSSRPNPTSTSYAGAVPHQPQQQPSLPHQQPPQQQQLYAQSNSYGPPPPDAMARMANANQSAAAARGRTTSTTTTAAAGLGGRRFSNPALVSAAVAPPLPAPPLPPSLQPTPAPTAEEGRVSSSSILNLHAQPHMAPLVGPRIQELVRSLDPSYTIDAQAEEQVLQLADDFLDKVCKQALRMASHRGSKVLDVQDVQLVLAKQWNIVIPGLGPPISKKPKILSPAKSHGATSTGGGGANKRRATSSSAKSTTKLSKSNLGESAPTSTA